MTSKRMERRRRSRHRAVPHLTSALLLTVVIASSAVLFGFTSSVRDSNEHRLLAGQADEMSQVLTSLGTQYEGAVLSAVVVADRTGGDPVAFKQAVTAGTPDNQQPTGWALLSAAGSRFKVLTTIGVAPEALALNSMPTPALLSGLRRAAAGKFEVVGIVGTGLTRRLILAAGLPGDNRDFVAYYEIPIIQAATSSSSVSAKDTNVGGSVNIALYVGPSASPDGLLFATAPQHGYRVTRTVPIGEQPVTFVVTAKHPLAGGVATDLPWILAGFLCAAGVILFLVVEQNLRKRDHALQMVDRLDAALEERDRVDAERMALEDQLRQAQRLEAIGQLAGGVAHDFNNLLAAIMGYADLLADDLGDHPSRPDVEEIRKAARRGGQLTSKLLQFGSREPRHDEALDLNVSLADMGGLLAKAVGEEIEIAMKLGPEIPTVLLGPGDLEQITLNLVVNARDAIDGKGAITVETNVVEESIPDPLRPPCVYARLTVSDTGSGMDSGTSARIFEPFFTTKERGRGTGLGLATVYGIVTRAGGRIEVTSTPGSGSKFQILLPTTNTPRPAEPVLTPVRTSPDRRGTILIVEDERAVRVPAKRMLERHGYTVLEAPDGTTAVEAFVDVDIDLLLTDVVMPGGLNGKEVAARFRTDRPELPVVYMSGYEADVLARRGVDDDAEPALVLTKPFSEADLLEAVARSLHVAAGATQ